MSYRRRVGSRGLGARRIVVVVERGKKEGRAERRAANENGDEGAVSADTIISCNGNGAVASGSTGGR